MTPKSKKTRPINLLTNNIEFQFHRKTGKLFNIIVEKGGKKMFEQAVNYKNGLYKELSRIGKGLSSDRRLEILDLLTQAPKSVETIANGVGISVANASRHLQILKDSHLVKTKR